MVPRTRTGGRPSLRVPRQHLCPRLRKQHFPRLENRNRLPAREGGEAATPAAGVVTATPGAELARFLGRASHDSYFSSTQRHQAVAEILARTIYGKEKRAEMVMARLLTEGVYTAAFPLREGPCDLPEYQVPGADLNPRQLLYSYWACWGCWQKYQPLHRIQEDFGDKAAIYFAWEEICVSRSSFLMCSLCDTCATWNISEICPVAKLGYLFDHLGTVFFSIFMCFWATAFLEHWKHRSTTLGHHWDCSDFQEEEVTPSSALQAQNSASCSSQRP